MPIVGNIQSHLDTGQFSAGALVDPKKLFDIVHHKTRILRHYKNCKIMVRILLNQ